MKMTSLSWANLFEIWQSFELPSEQKQSLAGSTQLPFWSLHFAPEANFLFWDSKQKDLRKRSDEGKLFPVSYIVLFGNLPLFSYSSAREGPVLPGDIVSEGGHSEVPVDLGDEEARG